MYVSAGKHFLLVFVFFIFCFLVEKLGQGGKQGWGGGRKGKRTSRVAGSKSGKLVLLPAQTGLLLGATLHPHLPRSLPLFQGSLPGRAHVVGVPVLTTAVRQRERETDCGQDGFARMIKCTRN